MTPTATVRTYRPRGSARELFACKAPEVLLSGPAGTGKSRACLEKLHHMCLMNPGMRALIVRKASSTLTSTALATYRQHVAAESMAVGDVEYYGGSAQEPAQYRYTGNGAAIVIGGMDRATKIMSSEYDIVYVQEAIELTENDWEALTTRLRNNVVSFQQIIADTNPSAPTHWLKARCDRGATQLIECQHADNPTLFDDGGAPTVDGAAYLSKLDQLTGVRHARLRRGLWVAAEGIVYDDLNPAVHFIEAFTPPPAWPRYWSIDFGYTNPFVCQWWAEDPDGRAYLYREVYMSGRIVEDHARTIMSIVRPDGHTWIEPRPVAVICDHDAEGRETFRKHTGIPTRSARKTVGTGIQAVQSRLKPAGDSRPRLFLMRGVVVERDPLLVDAKKPTCTVEEMPAYIWDIGAGKTPKEAPRKEDDHGMDALRYFVAERDLGSRANVRWM
jgi:PBSX family phage terminase large subunit